MLKLLIHNPSDRPRRGYVTLPLSALGERGDWLQPGRVIARCGGESIQCQVERGAVPELGTLLLAIDPPVPPGGDDDSVASAEVVLEPAADAVAPSEGPAAQLWAGDHVRVADSEAAEGPFLVPAADLPRVTRVHLASGSLHLDFALGDPQTKPGLAGAALSVTVDAREQLDVSDDWEHHHPRKRCMQIDLVRVSRPGWEPQPEAVQQLSAGRYELVACSAGPIRASAVVASPAFSYAFTDPFTGAARELTSRLYRRIAIHAGESYIWEEAWLHARAPEGSSVALFFQTRYVSYLEHQSPLRVIQYPDVHGWFAVASPLGGYAFATDAAIGPVSTPHPGLYEGETDQATVAWLLGVCDRYRAVHLLARGSANWLGHEVGRAWYELIFRPLQARLA